MQFDIINFEYSYFFNHIYNDHHINYNIVLPFSNTIIWMTLILYSQYPSTEHLLKILNQPTKNIVEHHFKKNIDLFNVFSNISIHIPPHHIHHNPLKNISFIEIIHDSQKDFIFSINTKYSLQIPHYYYPVIISSHFNNQPIKYLSLNNVFANITFENDIIYISLYIDENIKLCFVYNNENKCPENINHNILIENTPPNTNIENISFPKLDIQKKINYGKKFEKDLKQIHYGELIHGKYFNTHITNNIHLKLTTKQSSMPHFGQLQNIESIIINHDFNYYIIDHNEIIFFSTIL